MENVQEGSFEWVDETGRDMVTHWGCAEVWDAAYHRHLDTPLSPDIQPDLHPPLAAPEQQEEAE